MTVYRAIKKLDRRIISAILSGQKMYALERNLRIYEAYLAIRKEGVNKSAAILEVAVEFNVSDRHVWSVIARFSKKIKTN